MSFETAAASADDWTNTGEFVARHLAVWSGLLSVQPEVGERTALLYRIRFCVDQRDVVALNPLIREYALLNLRSLSAADLPAPPVRIRHDHEETRPHEQ